MKTKAAEISLARLIIGAHLSKNHAPSHRLLK